MSNVANRIPDFESERRLAEIRSKAAQSGLLDDKGVVPAGAPFPLANPENGYYGVPLLKEPQWKPEVPLYFFVGGAAGAAAVIANTASWIGHNQELVRSARLIAAGGGAISAALLTKDLGVPSRFLNMLRVFKVQSPMSVGAWTLTAFSSFAAASAFANLMQERFPGAPVRFVENASGLLAAATGTVMSSYTGVLIGATVIPVWNNHVGTLPMHFAASGMNSAISILDLMGHDDNRALNLLGLASCVYETAQGAVIEIEQSRVNQPLKRGRSGLTVRLGGLLSGPLPLALRLAYSISGNKKIRRAAAISSIAGSLLTRFGWLSAGKASARDASLPLQANKIVRAQGR